MNLHASPARDRALQAVVVGGSAGALAVISRMLRVLPHDFPVPIVVVVHQPGNARSLLTQVLQPVAALRLRDAEDKLPIEPGTVYVAPPDYHLLIDPGPALSLSIDAPVNYSRPSIDVLFESAADVLGDRCAAVLVSGANADGARGLLAVQRAGGIAIVQSRKEAEFDAMPAAALASCPEAREMPVDQVCGWLQQLRGRTATLRGAP